MSTRCEEGAPARCDAAIRDLDGEYHQCQLLEAHTSGHRHDCRGWRRSWTSAGHTSESDPAYSGLLFSGPIRRVVDRPQA